MRKSNLFYVILLVVICLTSCNDQNSKRRNSETENLKLVTNKIMYDVTVINEVLSDRSKKNPDWFWENLPSPDGDKFIYMMIQDVIDGNTQAYYFDSMDDYENFQPIPLDKQKEYLRDKMQMEVEYLDFEEDEVQIKKANIKFGPEHVKKLRFLEEWYVLDGVFYKEVIAVAPYFVVTYPGIDEKYSTIFFWMLINKE